MIGDILYVIVSFISMLGPVRGIDFHNNQPLFVSGGDDYKIKAREQTLFSTSTCVTVSGKTNRLARKSKFFFSDILPFMSSRVATIQS